MLLCKSCSENDSQTVSELRPTPLAGLRMWCVAVAVAALMVLFFLQAAGLADRASLIPLGKRTLKASFLIWSIGSVFLLAFSPGKNVLPFGVGVSCLALAHLTGSQFLPSLIIGTISGLTGIALFQILSRPMNLDQDRVKFRPVDVFCFLVIVLTASIITYRWRLVGIDDGLITARYVRNLINGQGWIYNPGEAVNGTTSTTSTLLIAVASLITGPDLRLAGALVYGIGMAGTGWLTFLFFRKSGALFALIATMMIAYFNHLQFFVGLETTLYLMFALATLHAYMRQRYPLAAFLAALVVLTRPDGGILTLVLLAHYAWTHVRHRNFNRKELLHCAAIYLLTLAPWLIFSYGTFGKLLPEGVGAKIAQGESGYWGTGWLFVRGMWNYVPNVVFRVVPGITWLTCAAMAASGVLLCLRHRPKNLLLFSWVVAQTAIYTLFGIPEYPWYYMPIFYAVFFYAAVLLEYVWNSAKSLNSLIVRGSAQLLTAAAGIAVAYANLGSIDQQYCNPSAPHYIQASEWIMNDGQPGDSIAAIEIGNLGYFCPDKRIVDMGGLITSGGADSIAKGDFSWWLEAEKPEYIVLHDPLWPFEMSVAEKDFFRAEYQLRHRIDVPNLYPVVIYSRKS